MKTSPRRCQGLFAPVALALLTTASASAENLIQDDFSSNSGLWASPDPALQADFLRTNGMLNFITVGIPSGTAYGRMSQKQTLSYTDAWRLQADIKTGDLPVGGSWNIGISLQNEDEPLYGLYFDLLHFSGQSIILAGVASPEPFGRPQRQRSTTSGSVSFQLFFDPATKLITASYDEDGAANGYAFQPIFKFGAESPITNWKMMTQNSRFRVGVRAQSNDGIIVAPGQLSFDNWHLDLSPSPQTTEVSLDGAKPFTSIQAAIDHANSLDTVVVHPGRYRENLDFKGKDITVMSVFGMGGDPGAIADTILDGSANSGPVVTFASEELAARLVGFTITGGAAEVGGGVRIDNQAVAEIRHCRIVDTQNPISVRRTETPSTLEFCTFANNFGPVVAIEQAPLQIEGCSFVANSSPDAVVDWFVYGGLVQIRHSAFVGNTCSRVLALPRQVSALPPSSDEARVINCTFRSNAVATACITSRASCVVLNSILLDDAPRQIDGVSVAADYNFIRGGAAAVHVSGGGTLEYGSHNLSDPVAFPRFADSGFLPAPDSATVGAGVLVWSVPGQPDILTSGVDLLGTITPAPNGSAPDIGAVELLHGGPLSILQSPLIVNAKYGEQLTISLEANNNPVAFACSNLPETLSVNRANGVISGIPTALGTNLVRVLIGNRWGGSTNDLQLVVSKGTPPVVWSPAASLTWGTPLDPTSVFNALSPLPGLFTFDPPLGSVLAPGAHTLTVIFTPFDPIHYETVVLTREIVVAKVPQQVEFNPPARAVLGDPPLALVATSSSGLPVELTVLYGPGALRGGALEITGGGIIGVQASQPGNAEYQAATPVLRLIDVMLKTAVVQKPGGSVLREPALDTVRLGELVSLTAIPDSGFVFEGWTGDVSSVNNPFWLIVTNNIRIEPIFTPRWTLAVTNSAGGHVLLEPPVGTIQNGTRITATAVADPGYGFRFWTGSFQGEDNPLSFTLNTNVALNAVFKGIRTITLRPVIGGKLSLIPAAIRYFEGDQIQVSADADEGYRFEAWEDDVQGNSPVLNLTLTNDLSLAARFRLLQRVELNFTGQGRVSALDGVYHDLGESVTVRAEPAAGWVFTGWTGSANATNNPLTVVVSSNTVLTAAFKRLVSLTVVARGGGAVQVVPAQAEYPEGTTITLTANPTNHFAFAGWSGALTGTNASTRFTITTNSLVEATFAPRHRITISPTQDFSRGLALTLQGEEGVQYSIEASSGLKGWTPLGSVTFRNDQPDYVDTQASGLRYRFYRLRTTD